MSKKKSHKALQKDVTKRKKREKEKRQKKLAKRVDLLKEKQEKKLEYWKEDILRRMRGNTTTIRNNTREE